MQRKTTLIVVGVLVILAAAFLYLLVGGQTRTQGAGNSASIADVVVPAEFSAEALIGQTAFAAKCASCHGPNASGIDGSGPPLIHKYYEPSHHGDAAFLQAAQNGVRAHHWTFGDMPPVDGITPAEVRSIIRYVRELQKENGIF